MELYKNVETSELFDCCVPYLKKFFASHRFPWEMLPSLKDYIIMLMGNGLEGFCEISEQVWIGENVKIHSTSVIEGPTILGAGTEVRPGAYIRGNVITGEKCVIGNSTEMKNSILLDCVQVPHYNYVGDSVLGNRAHMGAGAVCSNLKTDGKPVVIHGDKEYETGIRKIGIRLCSFSTD